MPKLQEPSLGCSVLINVPYFSLALAFDENIVAQMLVSTGRKLYFFSSYSRESEDRMEVDFLIAKPKITSRHNISPIEVKSSAYYTLSSIRKYIRKYSEYVNQPYVLHMADYAERDGMIFLPLYMGLLL